MRAALPTLALLALTAPAAAETRQHGNLLYDLPPGWTLGAYRDGMQAVLFHDDRCAFCYLLLGPGAPAEGDIVDWLERAAPRLVDPSDRAAVEVIQQAQPAESPPHHGAVTGLSSPGGLVAAMAIEVGGRFQLVGFQAPAGSDQEIKEALAFYDSDVVPVIDTFRFLSEGAPSLLPEAEPGPLSGLLWGWALVPSIGLDGRTRTDMDYRTLVLWPDGRFYEGTPPTGLDPLDPAALLDAADPNWGVYRIDGATLALAFADGRTETITAQDGGWSDGTHALAPVEPLPDGTPLSGTVSSLFVSGFVPGSGLSGSFASSTETTFFPDGRYEGDSVQGAFGVFTDASGDVSGSFGTDPDADAVQTGRYKVRNGLVLMAPDAGGPATAALAFRVPDGIMLGDQLLASD